ncbi:hypothetical protein BB561_001626 [Smittium simulii]|uniref:Uncharacterized protein n=1 Tax=Smittium simulii TaxID=133385 RepID=A0A2T9YTT8_9FUNG|nr:hypothetical protein BB561_001626 [Smittium simulii]
MHLDEPAAKDAQQFISTPVLYPQAAAALAHLVKSLERLCCVNGFNGLPTSAIISDTALSGNNQTSCHESSFLKPDTVTALISELQQQGFPEYQQSSTALDVNFLASYRYPFSSAIVQLPQTQTPFSSTSTHEYSSHRLLQVDSRRLNASDVAQNSSLSSRYNSLQQQSLWLLDSISHEQSLAAELSTSFNLLENVPPFATTDLSSQSHTEIQAETKSLLQIHKNSCLNIQASLSATPLPHFTFLSSE